MHTDWSSIYSSIDVNTAYDLFLQSLNKNIPLMIKTISNKLNSKKPGITKGIIKSIYHKNFLYGISLKLNTEESIKKYKTYNI